MRHFKNLAERYGNSLIVLLVDRTGGEKAIGEKYMSLTQHVNEEGGINGQILGFEWFDFHDVCRGMKFENVQMLIENLGEKMEEYGVTIEAHGTIKSRQNGVARTNCMVSLFSR